MGGLTLTAATVRHYMNNYDVIIVGAGHNGLVCGAYLAKRD